MADVEFEQLVSWFEQLSELTLEERTQKINQLRQENSALADALEAMWADQTLADAFFAPIEDASLQGIPGLQGQTVAGYQIGELLGSGGMGVVYRATREGESFAKDFALKVLPGAGHSAQHQQRFLLERKILASLNHPHIASLVDGGLLENHTPFLVMEFIDGSDLLSYCQTHLLGLTERIHLFLQVCDAVDYAHRQFIIHRDIKPQNILVNSQGQAKLLDFGIAKLLGQEAELGLTGTQQRVFTPDYASPEQVRGEPLSVATDIYSLGVVLYELLTQRKPFLLKGKTAGEILDMVRNAVPPKPSQIPIKSHSVKGAPWIHKLKGDLDTIVMKALRKEPQNRYLSVAALAGDLRRYLHHEPIRAQEPSWSYLAGKFVHRYRTAVVLVTLLILSLLGGLAASTQQARTASRAKIKAEQEAEKAKQVSQFLVQLFENANPKVNQGKEITLKALVDHGREQFLSDLDLNPEVKASLHGIFGRIYYFAGKLADAESDLHAYQLQKPEPDEDQDEWFKNNLYLAETQITMGKFDPATELLQTLVKVSVEKARPFDQGIAQNLLGLAAMQQRQLDLAESRFDLAEQLLTPLGTKESAIELAFVHNHRGMVRLDRFELEEAEAFFKKAMEPMRDRKLDLIGIMTNLAVVHTRRGHLEEAIATNYEVLKLKEAIHGPDAPVLATNYQNLGHCYLQKSDHQKAETAFQIASRLYSGEEENFYHAYPIVGLSKTQLAQGQYFEALNLAQQALRMLLKYQSADSILAANVRLHLAECLEKAGQFSSAAEEALDALGPLLLSFGKDHVLPQRLKSLLLNIQKTNLSAPLAQKVQTALNQFADP